MPPKKSTKKFEKNHLASHLLRRKEGAKIKQRQQIKAKRQARNAADKVRAPELGEEKGKGKGRAETSKSNGTVGGKGKSINEMSVDEFLGGVGVDGPEMGERGGGRGRGAWI